MAEHLLHVDEIYDGYVSLRLSCEHDDQADWCHARHGGDGECWLMSWWEGVGQELIGLMEPPFVWPLPVTTEGYGEDCSIVVDRDAYPSVGEGQ